MDTRIAEFPVLPRRDSPINQECIRNITPMECERLQGFPSGWTAGVADGHRFRLVANAVTAPVVAALGANLLTAMGLNIVAA